MACRHLKVVAALCVSALGSVSCNSAQQPPREVGWVGLYDLTLVEWLENENRLHELCSQAPVDSPAWPRCRDEAMTPKRATLPLRSAPEETATLQGTLVIQATPGQGLRAVYRPARGRPDTEFVPDLFDADWGYGPWFHQTFLDRRGTWFLLPAVPFPAPVWVHLGELTSEPDVRLLEAGQIIQMPQGDFVVLGVERRALRARPEQAADMWCGRPGDPPPLTPSPEVRIPLEELYGPTGHLVVDIKYKRGC